jgi:hypothetical protein
MRTLIVGVLTLRLGGLSVSPAFAQKGRGRDEAARYG